MNKKYLYLQFIFIYFLLNGLNAQTKNTLIDSSFNFLSDKYYEYKFVDSIKAKTYADIYLNKAKKEKDTINSIDGYYYLGEFFKNDSIYFNYLDDLILKTEKKPTKMFPAYAYMNKGWYYIVARKNNKSLKNYLLALKYSNKNDSLKFIIKQRIGVLKIKNKELSAAKKLFLKSYNYYNQNKQKIDDDNYFSLLENLSTLYIKTKQYDSALYFNKKVQEFGAKINNSIIIGYSYRTQGHISYKQKNYKSAINSYKKVAPLFIDNEDYPNLSSIYNFIAKSYSKLNQPENTLLYNLKIDSLYQKTNITLSSQKNSYNFLINYYKNKNDLKNQLKYIEKLIKVDSILHIRSKNLAKTFTEEYDNPILIAEKEAAIKKLEAEAHTSNIIKIILTSIALLAIILMVYQYQKRKGLKKRFYQLQKELSIKKENTADKIIKIKKIAVPEEVVTKTLKQLKIFETKKEFTNISITLNSLAKGLGTNSNYLSKIINHYKGKSFSAYLNELRINHTLDILQRDSTIKKYTIKAIANEVGFKNAESFSNAFHKKTGLKPSYYIKELNKKEAV
ncbi:helix-turn-helix domain-containing protein [Polaribacter sp. Asnod6-C07]|uniref:helix-turn-helix domain-containing protein n=1 Tax=Polaribacter sp. Asnod6-C07 TaxID=3160582 RepID=UPI003868877D